ncbi:MAG: SpaH/EbpB family LPXTG-anchored major pilin [Lachnospiraceae bacterium]|nr:SpaH/EbpB family LPXTG-anchored major pilin [Lachnospiraceae bacterium]
MKETKVTLKKIVLSIFMCLALVLGIMPVEEVKATDVTINTDATGSITIHKYEYNGNQTPEGTGEEGDSTSLPSGVNPLANAGFTLYKIVDANGLSTYYGQNPTALPDIDDYLTNNKVDANKISGAEKVNEQFTNSDGIVTFSNLPLGIYIVEETTPPPAVTSPVKPFLVSVPMTKSDGSEWLYDVHVFPKNSTKYGEVKIVKTNEKGEGLQGVQFALQKQNTDGISWTTITKKGGAQGDNTGDVLNLTTNNNGVISVDGLTKGKYRFIETSVGDKVAYIMDGVTNYEFDVNDDGTVTYNSSTGESIEIPISNKKADITKNVIKKDNTSDENAKDSDYSVGDIITYEVKIVVPENITQLKKFEIVDTPTNIDYVEGSIVLKDANQNIIAAGAGIYSVIKNTSTKGFTMTFTPANMGSYKNTTLTMTYKATLLPNPNTTTSGNENKISLEYSNQILPENSTDDPGNPNNPIDPNNPSEPTTTIVKDSAVVYSFQLNVEKKNEENTAMSGVTFDLYEEVSEGTTGALTGDGVNGTGLDKGKYWRKINGSTSLTTNGEGKVSQIGLSNGTYYLVETKTQAEYNLLKEPLEVTLDIDYATTRQTDPEISNSIIEKNKKTATTFSEGATMSTELTYSNNSGTATITVVNRKGFTLPTTGGAGSFLFTLIGCAIMIGGFIIFRKTSAKKSDVA